MLIYHNPKCSKSRETLALLEAAGVELEIVEYLVTPPSPEQIAELAKLLGLSPADLVRRKEPLFQALTRTSHRVSSRETQMPRMARLATEHKGGVLEHSAFGAGSVTQSFADGCVSQQKAGEMFGLDPGDLSDAEWCQLLSDHPSLLERPIVVANNQAVIGRPPKNVQQLLPRS